MIDKVVYAAGTVVIPLDDERKAYKERYKCCPPPLFIILISAAQLGVFIYYAATYDEWLAFPSQLLSNPLIFDVSKREQVWRFFSYMFLHAGLEHVLANLLLQLSVGIPLEMVHGSLRIMAIYIAGVLGGSMASGIFDPCVVLAGASGGTYALISAHLANVILNGDVLSKVSKAIRTAAVLLVLLFDFGYSIYIRVSDSPKPKVSIAAHVAGALVGLSMGVIALINFKKSLRDKVVFWICVGVYTAFMIFGIFWLIFYTPQILPCGN